MSLCVQRTSGRRIYASPPSQPTLVSISDGPPEVADGTDVADGAAGVTLCGWEGIVAVVAGGAAVEAAAAAAAAADTVAAAGLVVATDLAPTAALAAVEEAITLLADGESALATPPDEPVDGWA